MCPPGAHLHEDCSVCMCPSVTLHSQVMSDVNATIRGARISLESSPYKQLVTSDEMGNFQIDNVCLMNEVIIIEAHGCAHVKLTPVSDSDGHWTLPHFKLERNGTLNVTLP